MKCRIFVTTIAIALVASITALAAPKEKGKGGAGLLPAPIVQKLSEDQKKQYDALLAEAKGGDAEKMKEARKKAIELLTEEQKAELKKLAGAHGKKK